MSKYSRWKKRQEEMNTPPEVDCFTEDKLLTRLDRLRLEEFSIRPIPVTVSTRRPEGEIVNAEFETL